MRRTLRLLALRRFLNGGRTRHAADYADCPNPRALFSCWFIHSPLSLGGRLYHIHKQLITFINQAALPATARFGCAAGRASGLAFVRDLSPAWLRQTGQRITQAASVGDPSEDEAGVLVFAEDRILEPDGDAREGCVQRAALEIRGSVVLNIGVGGHDFPAVRLHLSEPGGVVRVLDPDWAAVVLSPADPARRQRPPSSRSGSARELTIRARLAAPLQLSPR